MLNKINTVKRLPLSLPKQFIQYFIAVFIFLLTLISIEKLAAAEFYPLQQVDNLRSHAEIFTDSNAEYKDLTKLLKAPISFTVLAEKKPNILGAKHWLKIPLKNNSQQNNTWILKLGYPGIAYLDAYWVEGGNIEKIIHLDENSLFAQRPINDPLIHLPLHFSAKQQKTLFLYYQIIGDVPLSLKVETPRQFKQGQESRLMVNALLLGFLIAIFLVVALNSLLNPNRTNFYYACFMFSVVFIISDICGFNYKYLWPNIAGLAENVIAKFFIILPCMQLLFIKSFLQLSNEHKKLNHIYTSFIVFFLCLLLCSFFINIIHLTLIIGALLAPIMIYTAIWSFNKNIAAVQFFALSLFSHVIFINVLTIIGSLHGPLSAGFEISSAIKLGYFIEAILFTTALTWQSKIIQRRYYDNIRHELTNTLELSKKENNQEQQSLLAKFEQEQNQMLADISHELRTPLTVMQMDIESLQHNFVDDVTETYSDLKRKVKDIDALLYQFSQAKKQTQAASFQLIEYAAKTLFYQIFKELSETNANINWLIKITINEQVKVNIDKEAIKQVLHCLLNNSLSFSDMPVGIKISVDEEKQQQHANLKLTFEDSSPSVATEQLEDIFQPLWQADQSRNKANAGTGMGLFFCKNTITSQGGQIWAEQSPLGGLAIIILLPIINNTNNILTTQ